MWNGHDDIREVLSLKKKTFLRRFAMVLLFFGALYTTLSTISNVTMHDIFMNNHHNTVNTVSKPAIQGNKEKPIKKTLKEKNLEWQHLPSAKDTSTEQIVQVMEENFPKERVVATGYTAGAESTGKTKDHPEYGITYSGVEASRGLYSTIAADLRVYPLGTIMYIPDYGYGVVTDKGSAIKGNKIDLYFQTVDDVYKEWGKKELDVFIVKIGDGDITVNEFNQLNENNTLEVFKED